MAFFVNNSKILIKVGKHFFLLLSNNYYRVKKYQFGKG